MNNNAVILFTNSPDTDAKLKTRMHGILRTTKSAVVSLAKECFRESIQHLFKKITTNEYSLLLSSSGTSLFDYLNVDEDKTIIQNGNSFGEKFYNSINDAFKKGFERVTIIGNDTTVVRKRQLSKALKLAASGKVCIGPSTNGGFYLFSISKENFRKISRQSFISLSYQTGTVFAELIRLLKETSLSVKFLEKKKYFNCSNELLVIQQFKNVLLLIRSEITKNIFSLLSYNFIRNIFVVTHSSDYQLSFHKAPPF